MGLLLRVLTVAGVSVLSLCGLSGTVHAAAGRAHARYTAGRQMLAIINADRRSAGLAPLGFDTSLAAVAKGHSRDMALHHYFSHTGLSGASPFDRLRQAGIVYRTAGENLGMDSGTDRAAMFRSIEVAMLHSPEHRANLLRPTFTHVGIGVIARQGTLYVTEDFTS
jgi:uncharacterized protein YkwD